MGGGGRLRPHHSPQVFLLGSTLCDTMCFNLSVFECVHSLLYVCEYEFVPFCLMLKYTTYLLSFNAHSHACKCK